MVAQRIRPIFDYLGFVVQRSGELDPVACANRCLANWSGVSAEPEIVDAVLTGDALKASLRAYASDKRWRVETGGIVVNGMSIPTDDRAKLLILGAAQGMADGSSAPMVVNGVVLGLFPKAVFVALNAAVIAHVQVTFPVLAALIAGINGGSITSEAEINAADWPSNT